MLKVVVALERWNFQEVSTNKNFVLLSKIMVKKGLHIWWLLTTEEVAQKGLTVF